VRRTGRRSGRPLLDGSADPLAAATDLLARRQVFYARAHQRVDTGGRTPEEAAQAVIDGLDGLDGPAAEGRPGRAGGQT
jgi:shikimate kinase